MSEIIEMPYGTGKSFEQQFIALFIEAYDETFCNVKIDSEDENDCVE